MTARGCSVHRRPLPERSAGRQVRLNGAARGADGRIDRSKMRDSPWDPLARRQVVWLFGTRVAETILASGPKRPHQQAGHMDASDPIRPQKPLVPRGPSTYGSRLKAGTTVTTRCRDPRRTDRAFAAPDGRRS